MHGKKSVNFVLIETCTQKRKQCINIVQIKTCTQKSAKMRQKEFTAKHRLFKATNLCKPRKFYTTAGGDGGDI